MKRKYLLALLVAIALLVTASVFAVQADTDPAELNKVHEAATQMTTDNVLPLNGATVTADCPACGEKNATWQALSNVSGGARGISGHWYLSGDRTNGGYYIPYQGNACLHLNGHSIKTTSDFALAGSAGYTFNIMGDGNVEAAGSRAYGTVFGQGTVRLFGGTYTATNNFYVVSASNTNANVYMFDGVTINGKQYATAAIVCADAGAGSNFYLYGGTINTNGGTGFYLTTGTVHLAGVTVNATDGCGVSMPSGTAVVNHSAGTISGATKSNVHMKAGTYNLSGTGSITGGNKEGNGGNVLLESSAVFNMTGGTISKGSAWNGGNVYITSGTFKMENGTITEGTASGNSAGQYYYYGGGNIYVNNSASAVANISGGTVSDGTATNNSGGNILCHTNGTLTVSGGTISGGTAGALGGNIMNGASTKVTISGGTISDGTSNTLKVGGRYHGDNITSFGGTLTVSGGKIESGGNRVGEGILACYNATLILDGDAQVTNAGKTGNIFVSSHLGETPILQVKSTFTGEAGVQWDTAYSCGDAVAYTAAVCDGAYTGKLYYEGQAIKPGILGLNGSLVIGTAQLMGKDGTAVWYMSNADAIAAYGNDTEYLMTGVTELALPDGNYTIDLAGQNMTITGTGTVTCFDSANDDYTANGSATITGATLANDTMTEVDGKQYVKLVTGNTYTFHRLDMRVSGVAFRPSVAGIYYTCDWSCDETLKNALDSFGVIVSTADMPDETFQDDSMWTSSSMDAFENGVTQNSVLIKDIFDTDEDNDICGKEDIYAVPYVLLGDEYLLPDNGVAYSLYEVLMVLDTDEYYYNNAKTLDSFYETWEEAMSDWGFENIGQPWGINPGEDDTLQLLMVGDAFSYYYVEELYGLLAEAGYEAEIYNLYYSGCTLAQHYNWWITDTANYQLFKTDSTGRKEMTPVSSAGWTLEQALAQGNWDYISLQGASGDRYIEAAEDEDVLAELCANSSTYAGPLLGQFYKRFPEAGLLWHRTWAFEVGRISGTTVYDEELLAKYDAGMQKVCDYMCSTFDEDKDYDLQMVNTGEAWAEARKLNADWIKAGNDSLLPAGGLCARLGVANANTYVGAQNGEVNVGDGYHDGDIGGGQLLNAYVWYMTLTGDTDLSDNKYRDSTYTILDARVNLLKNAAQIAAGFSAGSDMTVGLQIGYGRESITPDYSVNLWSGDWASRVTETVKDDIYVTCIAIREGEETVLLYTIDTLLVTEQPYYSKTAKARISNATGVPKENILLNATHTHSGVALRYSWTNSSKYRTAFYKAAAKAAETAIADLSAANTYAGGTQTQKLAFVRHYYNLNGDVCGANFGTHNGYTGHVREADQELQLVRFEREGKKDVLLMSFPSHATFYENGKVISADYPGYARSYIEKKEDVQVAFFVGAAGDQVPTSRISDEPDITDCVAYGEALGRYALDALSSGLKKVENSEVKLSTKVFEGVTSTHAADKLEGAKAIKNIASEYGPNSTETKAALAEYGFSTYYEALWVTYRASADATQQMNLRVLSIGDGLGFAIAPYEMFAMHGKQIKEQSPFETTMIITNSDGAMSYIPDENSYDYGAYEAHSSWFEKGTGEILVDEFVDMLTKLKGE